MVQVEPVTPEALVTALVTTVEERLGSVGSALRVAVDGASAAAPGALAGRITDRLRSTGRSALRVPAGGFLRPASLRFERGRHDADSFYEDWLDVAALRREVLDPLGPGGSGRYLPARWDADRDRATRAAYAEAPAAAVLLVDGALLLGHGLPFDLTVHLHLSAAALMRRTAEAERWTVPAYARYDAEVDPLGCADIVVHADDPRRPALQRR